MGATKAKAAKKTAKIRTDKNGVLAKREPTDVLTLAEAAAYLRVSETDVIQLANEQGLVGRCIGTEWRFLKSSLRDWLKTPTRRFSKEAFLALSGVWKDDPYIDEMLREIYKKRGRPMTEDEE